MHSNSLEAIKSFYDNRATGYDNEGGFHPQHQKDFLQHMSPKPGQHILDLACGTGGITLLSKKAVGPTGKVIGIDISPVSLTIAKSKAEKEGLEIEFLEHDISKAHEIPGIEAGGFDIVVCASALVLLKDPASAVKDWAKLLKRGGMLITDVPTDDTLVWGVLLDRVAEELGVETVHTRAKLDTKGKIDGVLRDAGLDTRDSFTTESYAEPKILDSMKAEEMFDTLFEQSPVRRTFYAELIVPERRERSKDIFVREMKKAAGPDGKIVEYLKVHIAIGRKL